MAGITPLSVIKGLWKELVMSKMVKCNCGYSYASDQDACPSCGLSGEGLARLQGDSARAAEAAERKASGPVRAAKASATVGASASNDQSVQVLQEMRTQTAELVKIRNATRTTRNFVVAGAIAFGTFFLFGGFIGLLALGS